jgi:hypothetical protein
MSSLLLSLVLFLLAAFGTEAYAHILKPDDSGVTFHTGIKLVVADVVVTDGNKRPVHKRSRTSTNTPVSLPGRWRVSRHGCCPLATSPTPYAFLLVAFDCCRA